MSDRTVFESSGRALAFVFVFWAIATCTRVVFPAKKDKRRMNLPSYKYPPPPAPGQLPRSDRGVQMCQSVGGSRACPPARRSKKATRNAECLHYRARRILLLFPIQSNFQCPPFLFPRDSLSQACIVAITIPQSTVRVFFIIVPTQLR